MGEKKAEIARKETERAEVAEQEALRKAQEAEERARNALRAQEAEQRARNEAEERARNALRAQEAAQDALLAEKKAARPTHEIRGKGSRDMGLGFDGATCIVLKNESYHDVKFTSSTNKSCTVSPGNTASKDWAFNAALFWQKPDVTVTWSCNGHSDKKLVQAGQVLVVKQR